MIVVYNTDQIYKHGGIEKVMATKANYLVQQPNYEVYIVTAEQESRPACYPLLESIALVDLGINYDRSKSYWSIRNMLKAVKHFWRQYKYYQKLQPDVVISPNYNFDHYWLPFLLPKKTKLLKELHSSRFYEGAQRQKRGLKNSLFWKLQDWIESKYDKVIVLNADEESYRPGTNVVIIPNPVEPSTAKAPLTSKKVIAAGRLAPVKGFDHLIEAWQLVHAKFPAWQLHIYGDDYGGTQQVLQKRIIALQLENTIQLRASVPNFVQTMLDYSIFALSSETECFPTVLLEALSVGLPLVSYDCPNGPRHIINHNQDGILVAKRKPEKLALALMTLMQDEEKRKVFGTHAQINSASFHTETIMHRWINLLNDLLV